MGESKNKDIHFPLPDELYKPHLRGSKFRPPLCHPEGDVYCLDLHTDKKEKWHKPEYNGYTNSMNTKLGFNYKEWQQPYYSRNPNEITCGACLRRMRPLFNKTIETLLKKVIIHENRIRERKAEIYQLKADARKRERYIEFNEESIRLLKWQIAVKKSLSGKH